jgi:hypothetical protein
MKLLTPKQLAERWSMSERTLANWRSKKIGPPYIKISSNILYHIEHIERIEEESVVIGESK